MAIRRITCIQFDGEFPDFCYRLVMPDYGLPVIGTILAEAGYDVRVYVEHVKPPEWARIAESDLVCFSCLNAGADKVYRLAREIRMRLGIPTVIGGTHATYFPESCLQHCDYVVLGEGDETIVELVDSLHRGGDVGKIAGVAYRVGDRVHRTPPRPGPARFDTIPNFDLIAGYRRLRPWDVVLRRKTPILTIQSSRGCPYRCTFCIVNTMFPDGYRKRDVESVIRDLRDKRRYGRNVLFVDNEFSVRRGHTKQLLRRIIAERLDLDMVVFARVEIAKDDELLFLMRQAGISYIYQGYESIQPETLTAYDKQQTLEQIVAAIEKLHRYGFGLLGSFVLGADTDTLETIHGTVRFALDQKLANAYFWPIWGHFPEERTGHVTITPWWRSIFRGWAYCDGHYVTHFPLRMPPSVLQRALIDAYRTIYSFQQVVRALRRGRHTDARWKLLHRYLWRAIEPGAQAYVGFLEEIEDGLYDGDGRLREDVLVERVRKDPRWTFQAGNHAIVTVGKSPLELPEPRTRNITCVPPQLGGNGSSEGVDRAISTLN
jgi:anaerobic magnesium-protoporphyrin IX monomethyl ester cyclase